METVTLTLLLEYVFIYYYLPGTVFGAVPTMFKGGIATVDTVVFTAMEEYDNDDGYGDDGKQQGAFSVIIRIYFRIPSSRLLRSTIADSAVSSTNIGASPLPKYEI